MDKLITALDNNCINKKLKNLNKYEIKYNDISYQEGILEILEKEEINIILLSEILKGPYDIKELINKIKEKNNKIEIIIILEKKNEELEKFLLEKNINNYFYNNELSIEDFYNLNFISKKINNNIEEIKNNILKINNKKLKNNIKINNKKIENKNNEKILNNFENKNINNNYDKNNNEINMNKNLISDDGTNYKIISGVINSKKILKNWFKKNVIYINKINKKINNINTNKINYLNKNKIIYNKLSKNNKKYIYSFFGKDSLIKSFLILIFSLILKNKKILNINLDFLNPNINTLFGVENFPSKDNLKLNNNIFSINKNIDYLSGLEEIIQNNYEEIILKINKLKNNYDYIFINLSSITNLKLTKKILEISDYNFCVFNDKENDIIYNNNLLKIYTQEWGINKSKFICLFNETKINKNNFMICIDNNKSIIKQELKNKYKCFNLNKYKLKNNYKEMLKCIKRDTREIA